MKAEPNFQAMSRQELMQYLEKDFDERALLQLEKRPIPQSAIDEHNEFLKWTQQEHYNATLRKQQSAIPEGKP